MSEEVSGRLLVSVRALRDQVVRVTREDTFENAS